MRYQTRSFATPLIGISLAAILLSSCSGGGGGSSQPEPTASAPAEPTVLTGVFTDSPVAGLSYQTASQNGTTNEAGEFQYVAGETVTFMLGNIMLGSVRASAMVSPLDLVGTQSIDGSQQNGSRNQLTNILLLLQSLDQDANPENGIDLSGIASSIDGTGIDFDMPPEQFVTGPYKRLVNRHGGRYQNPKNALNHLARTLGETFTVRLPTTLQYEVFSPTAGSLTVTYDHNEAGQLTEIRVSPGPTATIGYDEAGRLTSIIEIQDGETLYEESRIYNELGQLTEKRIEDHQRSFTILETDFSYDSAGNLLTKTITTTSGPLVSGPLRLNAYELWANFNLFYQVTGPVFIVSSPVVISNPEAIDDIAGGIALGNSMGITPNLDIARLLEIISIQQTTSQISRTQTQTFEYSTSGELTAFRRTSQSSDGSENELAITYDDMQACYNLETTPEFTPGSIGGNYQIDESTRLKLCGSVDADLDEEFDEFGRLISYRFENTGAFGGIVFELSFEFTDDGKLDSRTYTSTQTSSTGEVVSNTQLTDFVYDELGYIGEILTYSNGELVTRVTRNYEEVTLSQLP